MNITIQSWAAFFAAFVLVFIPTSSEAGETSNNKNQKPGAINAFGRALFGPKTPSIDSEARKVQVANTECLPPRCVPPSCRPTRVVEKEKIIYKEVEKIVEVPVEIPIEVPVYKQVQKEICIEVPVYKQVPVEIPIEVPVYKQVQKEIPIEVPVYTQVPVEIPIKVPVYVPQPVVMPQVCPPPQPVVVAPRVCPPPRPVCPPGTYPVRSGYSQPMVRRVSYPPPQVRHHPGYIQRPHYRTGPMMDPRNHRPYGGRSPHYTDGRRGGNYDRAMAYGHHVVNRAYGIGYGIGGRAYDAGRNW